MNMHTPKECEVMKFTLVLSSEEKKEENVNALAEIRSMLNMLHTILPMFPRLTERAISRKKFRTARTKASKNNTNAAASKMKVCPIISLDNRERREPKSRELPSTHKTMLSTLIDASP